MFPINQIRYPSSHKLRKTERIPCSICSQQFAEQKSRWNNDNNITEQRNIQRWHPFAKPFQRPGTRNRNSRHDKAKTNNMKRRHTALNRLWIRRE